MSKARYDFGAIELLEADAVGAPGQRRFRLLAQGARGVAALWLEKEQLQALAMAVDQITAGMPALWARGAAESRPPEPMPAIPEPSVEFTVGRLSLGFDEEKQVFALLAHDLEGDLEGEPTFRCQVTRGQLRALGARINAIVAAGRPRCALCGASLEAGARHVCAAQNGHLP
ncbi:MAG: DUF3090 family protein [Chloroflexi bacterium]|nr:DUF3090 family protein [Chloroflexota bacterium]